MTYKHIDKLTNTALNMVFWSAHYYLTLCCLTVADDVLCLEVILKAKDHFYAFIWGQKKRLIPAVV